MTDLGGGWRYEEDESSIGGPPWEVWGPPAAAVGGGPPPYGGSHSAFAAKRGRISEADLSDIFAVVYTRAAAAGNLKRITFITKQQTQEEGPQHSLSLLQQDTTPLVDAVSAAAGFCFRYVSSIFGQQQQQQQQHELQHELQLEQQLEQQQQQHQPQDTQR